MRLDLVLKQTRIIKRRTIAKEVSDAGTDSTHVYKPSQCFASKNWAAQAYKDAEKNGIPGRAVFFVHFSEPLRKISFPAHRIHQTGGSQIKAHNAR